MLSVVRVRHLVPPLDASSPLQSVMASSSVSAIAASKVPNTSKGQSTSAQAPPTQLQGGSVSTGDGYAQRRTGGNGSYGAGASSRASPAARNNQTSRKQHKGTKRYRGMVDEDAMAESVSSVASAHLRICRILLLTQLRPRYVQTRVVKAKLQLLTS